ncbi:enolase [Methanospirillum hungatei JF-1]|uniref:Enolase 2 n=1 Tax=Methanospirillum hungatei JF-1 (strain ATCC 27890 / DSM 864 / NBRC 100397 / JF-1) TaxID=323259 RepID=ENO2_METHJ|nr:phosphopyruvate hydratase [Methanospirillum hungatei]Q2FLB5.1 RecName: Full=Enolase 2; AltName: Full=2-phospho-D-glycerate hydro-lyase 2; AltName: Full=2-phosphoglycerate dehydratase 2 [Methanospirillum hungatei JF-1]ABD40850.1 enolase [Methanospirillum hungatei JF-1]OQA51049.1 MAG: Enolase [Euryarchaeota archaeon ADurb.Bin294]
MDTRIKRIIAREILDSRGNPTVEVDITLNNGIRGRAACPSGASTGIHEAVERRDGEKRFGGKGVQGAVQAVMDIISPKLLGRDALEQKSIDSVMIELDGTPNKAKLGANAILTVSMAVARAAANSEDVLLSEYLGPKSTLMPVPCMNIMNGGAHANWQGSDFQEYMIAPVGAPDYPEAVRWGCEVYHSLKSVLKKKGLSTGVGDEGGFAPIVPSNLEPASLIVHAIEEAGYIPGKDIALVLDPASSGFYKDGKYTLKTEKKVLTSEEMTDYYEDMIRTYPIISIEDGLAEDDWEGFAFMTKRLGNTIQIVGDDIFVTNPERIHRGLKEKTANAVLIKLNQIGTVTETIDAIRLAQKAGWGTMVSHRSGETCDSFIADLTVALGCGQLKTGAPCRGERVEKYNQLLRINEFLGDKARYAGRQAFNSA